jgi:hypothetical protein
MSSRDPTSLGWYIYIFKFFYYFRIPWGVRTRAETPGPGCEFEKPGGGGGLEVCFFFFFFPRTRVGYRGHELTRAKAWGWKPGLVICQPAKLQGWGLSPMSQDWFVYIYIFTPRLRELLSGRGTKIFYICFILFYFILFYFILFLASGSAERGGLEYILFYFMIFFLTSQSFKILFYMKSSFFLLKVHAAE